ncbi:transglycosylase SLT domain protein [Geopyxis carbonaria]|nr:transglycosylase SLT domain protein [Geopyxis carbonaria]
MRFSVSSLISLAVLLSSASAFDINPDAQGATSDVQAGSGPNGSEDWLNTGIADGSGWNPPFLHLEGLSHLSTSEFYAGAGSGCAQYDGYFQSAGSQYGVDPAILAMIAMQESSCNADAGGGTPGLMQVACGNYPDGSCDGKSIQDNVNAGAKVLTDNLNAAGGNVVQALGQYNGWFLAGSGLNGNKGLTADYPCSDEGKSNGDPQNLDYVHQMLNGWFQGKDVYGADSWIGTYQKGSQC